MNEKKMKKALKEILTCFFEKPKKMRDFEDFLGEVYKEMIDDERTLKRHGKWRIKAANKTECPNCGSTEYIKYVNITVSCPANTDNLSDLPTKINEQIKVVGIDWVNEIYFCLDCFDLFSGQSKEK